MLQETSPDAACSIERFANGEWHVVVHSDVSGRDCAIVGTIAPPGEQMTSLLLVADTLAKEQAHAVTAVLPYRAYARQDRDEPGASLAAAWTGRLLAASRVDRVTTIDIHSERAGRLYPIPVDSLSPASLFAEEITRLGLEDYVVVAPDEGGAQRAAAVAAAAGSERPVAVFSKRRTRDGVTLTGLRGALAPHATMTSARARIAAVAAVACLVALAGCGGGKSSGPTKAEFVEQADAICAATKARAAPLVQRVASVAAGAGPTVGRELAPTVRQLHAIAADYVAKLRALKQPSADSNAIGAFIAPSASAADAIGQAASLLQSGDTLRAVGMLEQLQTAAQQANDAALAYGLDTCATTLTTG
jgi:phosphoribosylpyrophosphate synthetase